MQMAISTRKSSSHPMARFFTARFHPSQVSTAVIKTMITPSATVLGVVTKVSWLDVIMRE